MYATQAQDQWCWAASIAMVFKHYGYEVSQPRIVNDAWGGVVNMPASPPQIIASLNRPWTDDTGRAFTAASTTYTAPISAIQDLDADRPLIIGTSSHAMVLTSLTFLQDTMGNVNVTEAYVVDPWPGRGVRMLSAQEWYGTFLLARIQVSAQPAGGTSPTSSNDDHGCSTGTSGNLALLGAAVAAARTRFRRRDRRTE